MGFLMTENLLFLFMYFQNIILLKDLYHFKESTTHDKDFLALLLNVIVPKLNY